MFQNFHPKPLQCPCTPNNSGKPPAQGVRQPPSEKGTGWRPAPASPRRDTPKRNVFFARLPLKAQKKENTLTKNGYFNPPSKPVIVKWASRVITPPPPHKVAGTKKHGKVIHPAESSPISHFLGSIQKLHPGLWNGWPLSPPRIAG